MNKGENTMLQFHHQKELQDFVKPILNIRVKELKDHGICMSREELFEYLKNEKWKQQKDLHLYEIADDILNYKIEKKVAEKE